jgi:hypothetical protein
MNFYSGQDIVKIIKWQGTHWEKIVITPIPDKGLQTTIYKNKSKNQPIIIQ